MKKIFFAMFAMLVALSCSESGSTPGTPGTPDTPPSEPTVDGQQFTANINESNLPTGEDGCKVAFTWTEGDLFSVFYNADGNAKYKYIGQTGSTSGNIAPTKESSSEMLTTCYAIYPYAEGNKMEDDVLYFNLPAEQTFKNGGLDAKANVLVAQCTEEDNNTFEFKSALGYVCVHVYGSVEVSSVTLKGNNDEVLAGEVSVDMINGEAYVSGEEEEILTLTSNEAVAVGASQGSATEFMFAMPSTTFDNGFTVKITDSKGKTLEQVIEDEVEIESGKIFSIEPILFEGDMSSSAAASIIQDMSNDWIASTREQYARAIENNVFTNEGLQLKIFAKTFGEKPADGRSLYISMHGGGATAPETNDSQWENQKGLYQPAEGVYVAPRAPWDDWNMWFKAGLDELFEQLIQAAVATWDVNPDKVYIMGYSAGGDGAYRMGTRMADKWAAVAMMAGHPNGCSMLNVRNTPFTLWCGANDSAMDRNYVTAEYAKILDDLQAADPEGYIHSTNILQGYPHWMNLEDKAALPWMAQYKRNPYPNKIVWQQAEVKRTSFYWVSIDGAEYKKDAMFVASVNKETNTINVTACDYQYVTFYLSDELLDLDKPVVVTLNGAEMFNGAVKRNREDMESSLAQRGDIRYIAPAVIKVKMDPNNTLENPTDGGLIEW